MVGGCCAVPWIFPNMERRTGQFGQVYYSLHVRAFLCLSLTCMNCVFFQKWPTATWRPTVNPAHFEQHTDLYINCVIMPKHGCTRPFDELQMISWVVFPLFVVAFSCLCVPPLPLFAQCLLSIPFGLVVVGLFYFAAKTTLSDSGDPQVYYGHQLQKDPEKHIHWTSYCVEGSKKCHVCKVHRQPLSEHCRVCKKCVETFDHHCKWLNNCIGSQNYYGLILFYFIIQK